MLLFYNHLKCIILNKGRNGKISLFSDVAVWSHQVQFLPPDLELDCLPFQIEGDPEEPESHSPRSQSPFVLLHSPWLLVMTGTYT